MDAKKKGADFQAKGTNPLPGSRIGAIAKIKSYIERKRREQKLEAPEERSARVTATATRWIAWFTFAMFITSLLSWWEIHSGSEDTHKLAEATVASSRAWVAPQQMLLTSSVEAGLPIKYQVRLFNPGKEPALCIVWALKTYGVSYIADGDGGKAEEGKNEMCANLNPTPERGTVLYPNGPMNFWLPLDIPDTSDNRALLESVQKRQKSLVIDGCFAYVTATQKHTSAFRFFLRDVAGPSFVADKQGNQVPAWNFNLALDGNAAD